MKQAVSRKLGWGCALALSLIGAAGWQAGHHIREQAVAARWVAHTHRVLAKLNVLHSFGRTTESAARAFLSTGQIENLLQFQNTVTSMTSEAQALRQLTADNPEQQRRLSHFEFTAADCGALAQHVLELARARDFGTAQQLWQGSGARSLRSRLDQLIAEAASHEVHLLGMRSSSVDRHAAGTTIFVVLGALSALAFLGFAAWQVRSEHIRRTKAEETLHQAQDELDRRVSERTVEINNTNVALQAEIQERQRMEEALQLARIELELRVEQRTGQLAQTNEELQREVGERRRIAEALKNSRALYHSLVENLPVHVWRTDLEGRYTFGNEHLCDCLGITQEDFLGKTAFEFYSASTAEKSMRDDQWVLDTGDAFEDIEEFLTTTGRGGYQQVLKTPYYDSEGKILGVQGIGWDVTERKHAEQEMQRIQVQLEQMNRDLHSKNEEIQNFYHTLSHELRTPLTSMREFVSIVMDGLAGPLNETQRDYLSIARESCNQMRVCINDLLDATRLETGKLSIERKPASLAALVQRSVTAMQPVAAQKRITLSHDIQPNLPEVPLDENRIQQVINNLVANALKFTNDGGKVTVAASEAPEAPEFLQVTVTDTGRGIGREELDRIFDRLYQVKTGDAATGQGVGLGLFLCRELVLLHGGSIEVQSELGKGSVFRFLLPKRPPAKRYTLLVVDDDPALRDILCQLLVRADFAVAAADGGHTALEVMRRTMPDLVVLDLAMPDLDGASTLKAIRERWGALPVILHTGFAEGELMERARISSPFTLLTKPCSPQQLITMVRQLVHHEPEGSISAPMSGEESTLLTA